MCLGIQEVFVVISGSFVSTHRLKRAIQFLVSLPGFGSPSTSCQTHTRFTAANLSNSPLGGVTRRSHTEPRNPPTSLVLFPAAPLQISGSLWVSLLGIVVFRSKHTALRSIARTTLPRKPRGRGRLDHLIRTPEMQWRPPCCVWFVLEDAGL